MNTIPVNTIIAVKNYLNGRDDISFAYLFGSRAMGVPTPLSDVDIAVHLTEGPFSEKRLEICLDISGHIISDEKLRVPETYADAFRILVEDGILSKLHLAAFEKMADFRNIVVHDYERIDPEIVVAILRNNLRDFEAFKSSVIAYLDK